MDTQKRIRELMEERRWTDYRLAKEANLSHSTVTNMFNRNNAPTLPTLEAVCRAFGITLAQFFAEGEEAQLTEDQQKLFSMQFAPSSGHWCVCQRPLGGVQRPPLLRFFDRLNDNNVVLRCPLHYSVGRYLVIHDHRFPTPRFTLGADNGTLG